MLYGKRNYTVHSLVWDSGMEYSDRMAESTILEPSWEKQIDSNCQEFQTWWGKTSFDCERAVSVGANYYLEV